MFALPYILIIRSFFVSFGDHFCGVVVASTAIECMHRPRIIDHAGVRISTGKLLMKHCDMTAFRLKALLTNCTIRTN